MGRVSLTESYDDRSVISKLNEMDKRVTENTTVVTAAEASAKASAQAAQETADRFAGSVGAVVQNANQQINASKAQVDQAKAEVDATVTTVAQAVETANQASASAQQSATTVSTYDARLTAVEDADTQNVKLSGNQDITGIKTVPTAATGARDTQIANGTRIQNDLDAYEPMLRTTGNQIFSGVKHTNSPFEIYGYGTNSGLRLVTPIVRSNSTNSVFCDILNWCDKDVNRIISLRITQEKDGSVKLAFLFHKSDGTQINIGYIGIDVNGNPVKSGVFA